MFRIEAVEETEYIFYAQYNIWVRPCGIRDNCTKGSECIRTVTLCGGRLLLPCLLHMFIFWEMRLK
jgi:hypothetical protein